ncbi:MAG: hypothetical protein WD768_09645 [Phycisphaeraceae bacterium]
MSSDLSIAFLSQGRLFVTRGGAKPQLVESRFAQDIIDRETRQRQRDGWKAKSAGWQVRADGGMLGMEGFGDDEERGRRIHITAVARCPSSNELLYALDTETVGGLFHYSFTNDDERRLVHHHEFRIFDMARHESDAVIVCCMRHPDGSASIATVPAEGGKLRQITEGDSVDESPSWAQGGGQRVVFQSAGIGRNPYGAMWGLSQYRIEMLDMESGRLDTLLDDAAHDLLLPRMTTDGSLYFVRRPYFPGGKPPTNPLKRLGDVLLYPLRLMQTLGAYFNFKSMIYRGKPLTTATGPQREGPDLRHLMLWGRFIDVKKAERELARQKTGGLVPKDWQLVRRKAGGEEEVIATSVLAYDLTPAGDIIYTNGTAIFHRDVKGNVSKLLDEHLIERVVSLG